MIYKFRVWVVKIVASIFGVNIRGLNEATWEEKKATK